MTNKQVISNRVLRNWGEGRGLASTCRSGWVVGVGRVEGMGERIGDFGSFLYKVRETPETAFKSVKLRAPPLWRTLWKTQEWGWLLNQQKDSSDLANYFCGSSKIVLASSCNDVWIISQKLHYVPVTHLSIPFTFSTLAYHQGCISCISQHWKDYKKC